MIAVRYVGPDRARRLPALFPGWHDTFVALLCATTAVGRFLAEDLAQHCLFPWFHAAAAATGSGAVAADVANAWVMALRDNGLHLDDYEAASTVGVSGRRAG
jgi:hypothetical protein